MKPSRSPGLNTKTTSDLSIIECRQKPYLNTVKRSGKLPFCFLSAFCFQSASLFHSCTLWIRWFQAKGLRNSWSSDDYLFPGVLCVFNELAIASLDFRLGPLFPIGLPELTHYLRPQTHMLPAPHWTRVLPAALLPSSLRITWNLPRSPQRAPVLNATGPAITSQCRALWPPVAFSMISRLTRTKGISWWLGS